MDSIEEPPGVKREFAMRAGWGAVFRPAKGVGCVPARDRRSRASVEKVCLIRASCGEYRGKLMSPAKKEPHQRWLRALTAHAPATRAFIGRLVPTLSRAMNDDDGRALNVAGNPYR